MWMPLRPVVDDHGLMPVAHLAQMVADIPASDGALQAWALPEAPLLQPMHALEQPTSAAPGEAAAHYLQALHALARQPERSLGLSVRLPFCAARCLCCDRPVHVAQPTAVLDAYVSALIDEVEAVAGAVGGGRDMLQLHLGGGTANELNESQLVRLVSGLQRHWRLPADAEASADCDPRRVGEFQLRLLRGLGFRRLNFGVLDLDADVQRAIGRQQSAALVDDVCDLARHCGIDYVNLELMLGLPHQTLASWQRTLQRVLAMAPDRLRVSRYHHRPMLAPAQRALDRHAMPTAQDCEALSELTVAMLCGAGYRWIGAEQFVLENDELAQAFDTARLRRSLIAYTATEPAALLGFGVGAVSDIDGDLFWNAPVLSDWCTALHGGRLPVERARLSDLHERRRRAAVEQLLCRHELPAAHADGSLESAYQGLALRAAEGLVQIEPDRLVLTARGRHALHRLCSEFSAAPAAAATQPGVFPWIF
jgi:oxygen-independent coproporphyrinogen-3 oxidase